MYVRKFRCRRDSSFSFSNKQSFFAIPLMWLAPPIGENKLIYIIYSFSLDIHRNASDSECKMDMITAAMTAQLLAFTHLCLSQTALHTRCLVFHILSVVDREKVSLVSILKELIGGEEEPVYPQLNVRSQKRHKYPDEQASGEGSWRQWLPPWVCGECCSPMSLKAAFLRLLSKLFPVLKRKLMFIVF